MGTPITVASRDYPYAVGAELTVASSDKATAVSQAATLLGTIASDIASAVTNVELSFPVAEDGDVELSPAGGGYAVNGALLIGADASEDAQTAAAAAAAAIATAVDRSSPAVAVTLDNENGRYVVQEVG